MYLKNCFNSKNKFNWTCLINQNTQTHCSCCGKNIQNCDNFRFQNIINISEDVKSLQSSNNLNDLFLNCEKRNNLPVKCIVEKTNPSITYCYCKDDAGRLIDFEYKSEDVWMNPAHRSYPIEIVSGFLLGIFCSIFNSFYDHVHNEKK